MGGSTGDRGLQLRDKWKKKEVSKVQDNIEVHPHYEEFEEPSPDKKEAKLSEFSPSVIRFSTWDTRPVRCD